MAANQVHHQARLLWRHANEARERRTLNLTIGLHCRRHRYPFAAGAAAGAAPPGAAAAAAFSSAAFTAWPLNVRVGENSPSLWPTICSVMYTGMNFLPLWTAIVCPTISGRIVERRDHVFTTFFSFRAFIPSTFSRRWPSMNGPFFSERGMSLLFLHPAQLHPLGAAHLAEAAHRSGDAMRKRAEGAHNAGALRIRNLFHNHGPSWAAQAKQNLRRRSEPRGDFRRRLCRRLR